MQTPLAVDPYDVDRAELVRPYRRDQDDVYAVRYIIAGGMSVVGLAPLCGIAIGDLPWTAAAVVVPALSR